MLLCSSLSIDTEVRVEGRPPGFRGFDSSSLVIGNQYLEAQVTSSASRYKTAVWNTAMCFTGCLFGLDSQKEAIGCELACIRPVLTDGLPYAPVRRIGLRAQGNLIRTSGKMLSGKTDN